MNPQALANGIQLAIAPVFLLTAIAGLIGALAARLARIIDRARHLEDLVEQLPERLDAAQQRRLAQIDRELAALKVRSRMINYAMALLVLCALLIGVTILELFLLELGPGAALRISSSVPFMFVSGIVCFIAALGCFLREVLLSTQTVRIGHRRVFSAMAPEEHGDSACVSIPNSGAGRDARAPAP
jgi:hypothetical protein